MHEEKKYIKGEKNYQGWEKIPRVRKTTSDEKNYARWKISRMRKTTQDETLRREKGNSCCSFPSQGSFSLCRPASGITLPTVPTPEHILNHGIRKCTKNMINNAILSKGSSVWLSKTIEPMKIKICEELQNHYWPFYTIADASPIWAIKFEADILGPLAKSLIDNTSLFPSEFPGTTPSRNRSFVFAGAGAIIRWAGRPSIACLYLRTIYRLNIGLPASNKRREWRHVE